MFEVDPVELKIRIGGIATDGMGCAIVSSEDAPIHLMRDKNWRYLYGWYGLCDSIEWRRSNTHLMVDKNWRYRYGWHGLCDGIEWRRSNTFYDKSKRYRYYCYRLFDSSIVSKGKLDLPL